MPNLTESPTLTSEWQMMTALAQMGNIGAEVGRALQAKTMDDTVRLGGASTRMYELFALSLGDPRWRGTGFLRELCRAKEVVSDFLYGENQYGETAASLEGYFIAYGIMANAERRKKRLHLSIRDENRFTTEASQKLIDEINDPKNTVDGSFDSIDELNRDLENISSTTH